MPELTRPMKTIPSLILVATMVVVGCGAAGSPAPSAATATASAAGTPAASITQPTPATAEPKVTPPPVPVAEIVTGDATTPGAIGSYSVDGRGSDAPWLPFVSLPSVGVGARETPSIQFADGTPLGNVQVLIAAAVDTSGASAQGVASAFLAANGRSVVIGPLPAGRWVIAARLFRADGRGDGTTYWAITVQ